MKYLQNTVFYVVSEEPEKVKELFANSLGSDAGTYFIPNATFPETKYNKTEPKYETDLKGKIKCNIFVQTFEIKSQE